jgi:CheY-like chemotaxis protein
MESLGGNCGVESRLDGQSGSCFWISIPFKPDETVAEDLSTENEVGLNLTLSVTPAVISSDSNDTQQNCSYSEVSFQNSPKLRILLVDDSIMIRKATSRSLGKEGYQVEVAQNGAECLKKLTSTMVAPETVVFEFDLILMDLQMPVMDGLEATRRIRALEHTAKMTSEKTAGGHCPRIMIIGISANTAGEARDDCMRSGMDGFIEKPLRMEYFQSYFSNLWLDLGNN